MTPKPQAEQNECPTSLEGLVDRYGFAKVERSCPDHAALIFGLGRALELPK